MYYDNKREVLQDLFGSTKVHLKPGYVYVDGHEYPILDDVVILLDPSEYPSALSEKLGAGHINTERSEAYFAPDIQFTFGEEWKRFSEVLPEHENEFNQYFDLIDLSELGSLRICDLGCGSGRWSFFLNRRCREIILVDFSEAIFVARRNLIDVRNALFFMGDLAKLPFREDFADLIICLGVLHHLPSPALDMVKALGRFAPRFLIYLYYALDNRPIYFRTLLRLITWARQVLCRIRSPRFRGVFTWLITVGVYLPMIEIGSLLQPLGLGQYVPLYEAYSGKSTHRISQDVYDRFFTRIEQRYSKEEIFGLSDAFSRVVISERIPYWHFICER